MKANCNCGTTFNAESTTETIEGVEIAYSECPNCNQRYLSHIIDDEVEDKLSQVHQLVTDNDDITEEQAQAIWDEYNDMAEEVRDLMKAKESEYQHLVEQVI